MRNNKMGKKIATYAMAAAMIGGVLAGTGSVGVSAATKQADTKTSYTYNNGMTSEDYKKMYEDYISQFIQTPEVTYAVFDHGYIFPMNVLSITFSEVKYAKSYEVMVSKDNHFNTTKTYTTDKTSLSVSTDKDDFITPAWHGRYVKVRANYGYGMYGKWSEAKMIGCGKLHLNQDFNNLTVR